ncbi:SMP-30/gluconolactonase/LRE family protein [Thalassotalea castellviae]|uniref:SMP-30/gluconolactonase/LRE family protein n=1 Tax=Thalassotalea castellviae TaxID=3075612 RepID=A0ABU2ZZ39_9GAMM|nr:SMP-30/gluconolactonase/LRE family protein [Thalassotalea sp. W431]MDT0603191.1 SMP-30/gluconolactonase/LRE family protein [Thalassotalea sp. W431]
MQNNSFVLSLLFISATTLANIEHTTDWMPDHSFTQGVEGPAVDKDGTLFAVNFAKEGTIGKVTQSNKGEIYLTLPNGSIGNGIRFDHKGNMYIADYVNHNVLIVEPNTKNVKVFSHNKQMNQPNDIAIMDNGILFASDPNWPNNTGNLWRINADGTNTLLEANMGTTNGVEVSPDNKTLYVNESVQRTIWRYSLDENGNIQDKSLFFQFKDHGLDGMRTDNAGNLYVARYGAGVVAVLSPQGELIKTIQLTGKHPTNVAFGGIDGKQLFITMQKRGAIETYYNHIAGRNYR